MRALIPQHPRSWAGGASAAIWLSVFLSPTVFCLLLAVWNRSRVPVPSQGVIISLFCLIPVVALVVCGGAVWRSQLRGGLRFTGLVMTALGMALQVGVLLWIIVSAITAAIALP